MTLTLLDTGDSPAQLLPAQSPLLTASDRGFTYGDGLFETIRVLNGQPLFLQHHISRLFAGLAVLNLTIPWDSAALTERIHSLVAANAITSGVLRLTLSRGSGPRGFSAPTDPKPLLIIQSAPQPPPSPPATAILAPWRTDPASPLPYLKSLSALDKVLAQGLVRDAGMTEALFLNTHGHLTEATASNLFLIHEGQLLTPTLASGLLPGITRQLLIELAPRWGQRIIETELTLDQLTNASEAFLTNTVVGLRPLVLVEGQPIGSGQPGTVTLYLSQAYQQFCEASSQTPPPQVSP